MLKNFMYQRILSELDELLNYNTFTDIAISENSYDAYVEHALKYVVCQEKNSLFLDNESRSKLDKSLSLKEIFYPLIDYAWNAIFDENGKYRNFNMRYRKYLSREYELKNLQLEELIYLHIELTTEYVVDLSPKSLNSMVESSTGYEIVEIYKKYLAELINGIRAEIDIKREINKDHEIKEKTEMNTCDDTHMKTTSSSALKELIRISRAMHPMLFAYDAFAEKREVM